jgi:hypothetical protein
VTGKSRGKIKLPEKNAEMRLPGDYVAPNRYQCPLGKLDHDSFRLW